MKKSILVLLSSIVIAGCSSSTASPTQTPVSAASETPAVSAPAALEDMTAAQQLETLQPCLNAYTEVLTENFYLDAHTSSDAYAALYNSEEDANSGDISKIVKMVKYQYFLDNAVGDAKIECDGLYIDGTILLHYPITAFSTKEELSKALSQCLGIALYENILDEDVMDYDGVLYAVYGGRGYGNLTIDENSLTLISHDGDTYVFTVDGLTGEDKTVTDTVTLPFKQQAENSYILMSAEWQNK